LVARAEAASAHHATPHVGPTGQRIHFQQNRTALRVCRVHYTIHRGRPSRHEPASQPGRTLSCCLPDDIPYDFGRAKGRTHATPSCQVGKGIPAPGETARRTVERWLSALPAEVRAGIEVVSIDPYDGYRQAIRAALPHARIVCDHFHLVRGANAALDAVRRECQRQAKARRPKGVRRSGQHAAWRPELYRARHRLLKARERLSERERRRLSELFEREPLIAEAWGLKESFRRVYRATDRVEAERRLEAFLGAVERAGLPAFDAFAKGIRIWQQELLAYFDEPTTNGYAEGIINKVKVIKRRAYGIPTFTAFRQRVLLACG
jgi:transposase